MECRACLHEHMVWDDIKKGYAWKDTEPFIQIKGRFHIKGDFKFEEDKEVKLFACPKCATVQMRIPDRFGRIDGRYI